MAGLLLCFTCFQVISQQASAQTETKTRSSWSAELRAANDAEDKFFNNLHEGDPSVDEKSHVDVEEKGRKLIRLRCNGVDYVPLAADVCTDLVDKFKCSWNGGDSVLDSYFYLYGSPSWYSHSIVPYQARQTMQIKMAWEPGQLEQLDFYTGDPGEMHQNGYKNVLKLNFDKATGQLNYKARDPSKQQALFVLIKAKDEKRFRRFVFVVVPKRIAGTSLENQSSDRQP